MTDDLREKVMIRFGVSDRTAWKAIKTAEDGQFIRRLPHGIRGKAFYAPARGGMYFAPCGGLAAIAAHLYSRAG